MPSPPRLGTHPYQLPGANLPTSHLALGGVWRVSNEMRDYEQGGKLAEKRKFVEPENGDGGGPKLP